MSTDTPNVPAPNALIPVFTGQIGGESMHVCDGRTLHTFLENGDMFAHWINNRIEKYGFIENQDFALICGNSQIKGRGGDRRSKNYLLALDMAKELSMVENNDKGRQARHYFIECERRAHETIQPKALPSGYIPRTRLLLTLEEGQVVRSKPVPENACVIDPTSRTDMETLFREFVPGELMPGIIKICTDRLAYLARNSFTPKAA